jgi:Amt family ammonium transporter
MALLVPVAALAQDEAPVLSAGDTAWMLTATALVLMMTIPGLALFYGSMVRSKNVNRARPRRPRHRRRRRRSGGS